MREWVIDEDVFGGLTFGRRVRDGYEIIKSIEVARIEDGHRHPGSAIGGFFGFGDGATSFLQAVMDHAYARGLRPSKAQDERHLINHLKDMRQIAFHALNVPKE